MVISSFDRNAIRILVDLSLGSRLLLTTLYIVMAVLGYCLMLLAMTFNVGVLFMLCIGLMIGHLIFFDLIGLPKLPECYKQLPGSGAYLPEADNCCCTVTNEGCSDCPMKQNDNSIAASYHQVSSGHGSMH